MASQVARKKIRPAVRTPTLGRGHARVAALKAAGAAVFAEKGYDAATMTEVAAKAGAAIGSLYQFFPTKELLAASLHEDLLAELSRMLEEVRRENAGRPLTALADRLFAGLADFLLRNPAFTALADRRDIDRKRKRATRAQLRGQIAALLAQATPPLAPGKAETVAIVILQLMKAVVSLNGEDASIRETVVPELKRMLQLYLESVGGE